MASQNITNTDNGTLLFSQTYHSHNNSDVQMKIMEQIEALKLTISNIIKAKLNRQSTLSDARELLG